MRVCLITSWVLALVAGATSAIQAQGILGGITPVSAMQVGSGRFRSLGRTMSSADGMRGALAWASAAPPAIRQADSLASHDTHAEAGAIIGGLAGAVGGGLAFAHWTHRTGAVNNGTGTLGGAVVGAGLVGGLAALAGLLIGSAIPH